MAYIVVTSKEDAVQATFLMQQAAEMVSRDAEIDYNERLPFIGQYLKLRDSIRVEGATNQLCDKDKCIYGGEQKRFNVYPCSECKRATKDHFKPKED